MGEAYLIAMGRSSWGAVGGAHAAHEPLSLALAAAAAALRQVGLPTGETPGAAGLVEEPGATPAVRADLELDAVELGLAEVRPGDVGLAWSLVRSLGLPLRTGAHLHLRGSLGGADALAAAVTAVASGHRDRVLAVGLSCPSHRPLMEAPLAGSLHWTWDLPQADEARIMAAAALELGEAETDGWRVAARERAQEAGMLEPLGEGLGKLGGALAVGDQAAAWLVVSGRALREGGLKPLARIVSIGEEGVDPMVWPLAASKALAAALEKMGFFPADLSRVCIDDGCALSPLAAVRRLELAEERVNPLGSRGVHAGPATALILLSDLLLALQDSDGRFGAIALSDGLGLGLSFVVDREFYA
jgi:acetyl-CoA acetyltransferase